MSKYDKLKFLKTTKARKSHPCEECKIEIKKGDLYYSETLGRIDAPGIKLKKFCYKCGKNL